MKRIEQDPLGTMELDKSYPFGIHTRRAENNFKISGLQVDPDLFLALIQVKKAAAIANRKSGMLDSKLSDAIEKGCDYIIDNLDSLVPDLDPYQGGAGTSTNMAANELIANMALQTMDKDFGEYDIVSPLDHVNLSQSTNDCYPTALKIAIIKNLRELETAVRNMLQALQLKEKEFSPILKIGRTQLQDALPISMGQEFGAWAESISRFRWRLEKSIEWIREVNISGTAIGTSLNADPVYSGLVIDVLRKIIREPIALSRNLIDGTQNLDQLVEVSGLIKSGAVSVKKISNDMRLLASGPACGFNELILPKMQAGSSIMPGKSNPVILEAVIQVCFQIIGNDGIIAQAVSESNLELPQYLPLVGHLILTNIKLFRNVLDGFDHHIKGIQVNKKTLDSNVNHSIAIATLLTPLLGYDRVSDILASPKAREIGFIQYIKEEGILTQEMLDQYLRPEIMASPGMPQIGDKNGEN